MSFSKSSSQISIDGGVLSATCRRIDGSEQDSELDLNNCIGNIEGVLTWGESGFADSSKDISINGSHLSAHCQTSQGNWLHSTLNLDHYVGNQNGNLQA